MMAAHVSDVKFDVKADTSLSKEAYIGELRKRYLKFFEDVSYSNTIESIDLGEVDNLYAALCKFRKSNLLSVRRVRACCAYTSLAYKYSSFEDKVKIIHYLCLVVELGILMSKANVDDSDSGELQPFVEDSRLFTLRFCDPEGYEKLYPTRGPLHPCYEELIVYCKTDLNPFFPNQPRMHMAFLSSVLVGVEGNLMEKEYVKSAFKYAPESPRFPAWLRLKKSGALEAFVMFFLAAPQLVPGKYSADTSSSDYTFFRTKIYPMISDLFVATNHLNNIMTFYKDMDAEDGAVNFITSQAQAKQSTPLEVFDEVANEVVGIRKSLMVMAERSGSNSDEVKIAIQHYFQGFIAWHISYSDLFRLSEVVGEDWHKGEYL